MDSWVLILTFAGAATPAVADAWEDDLAELDAAIANIPARGIDVTAYSDGELSMREAFDKVGSRVT